MLSKKMEKLRSQINYEPKNLLVLVGADGIVL